MLLRPWGAHFGAIYPVTMYFHMMFGLRGAISRTRAASFDDDARARSKRWHEFSYIIGLLLRHAAVD